MITSVVVTYRVVPEAVTELMRLIEAAFEQLQTEKPAGEQRSSATTTPLPNFRALASDSRTRLSV